MSASWPSPLETAATAIEELAAEVHRLKGDLELVVVDLDHVLCEPEHVLDASARYRIERAMTAARRGLRPLPKEPHA